LGESVDASIEPADTPIWRAKARRDQKRKIRPRRDDVDFRVFRGNTAVRRLRIRIRSALLSSFENCKQ
jgi:hypothetical protein